MKIKEMFRTRRNKDHLEVVFVDMERAEDVLTVRFFPVEDRENSLPDVQVNIGVVNGTSPAEWDTPSDPGEWDVTGRIKTSHWRSNQTQPVLWVKRGPERTPRLVS